MIEDEQASIYAEVPGGPELLTYFGRTPAFGDAEVLSLSLDRGGPSTLRVQGWVITDRADDADGPERHAVVTFALDGGMDFQLDGFSIQNVIGGLILRRGLAGLIRARSVSITFEPGEPVARGAGHG